MINAYLKFFNEFNMQKNLKNEFFYTKICSRKIELLQIFQKLNIIYQFSIIEINKLKLLKIVLNKKNTIRLKKISSITNQQTLQIKQINRTFKQCKKLYLMSTDRGLITTNDAKCGGIVLFEIFLKK